MKSMRLEGQHGHITRCLVIGWVLLLMPAVGHAQNLSTGTIAGVVRDESGGVLPGVTAEAASPALIEKVRTVVTDDKGLYSIVDLRPGTYTVTFTLSGFSTYKREGVELTTGFTATVNADMKVGSIEETVTVSGTTPLVDTHNVNQQKVFAREVTEQLPLAATLNQYATLIPGAILTSGAGAQDVGGNKGEFQTGFQIHGSLANDFQQLRDGMFWGTLVAAGNKMSSLNPATVDEVTVQTSGATAEAESGGALINVVPRDGGNVFKGSFAANFANKDLQNSNLDETLKSRGVTQATSIRKRYDVGGGFGGPIMKDKLWFLASVRYWITSEFQPGNYFNQTPGTLFYTADLSRPAYDENYYQDRRVRLTWQATPKNKISASYGNEDNCNCFNNVASGLRDPSASGSAYYNPDWNGQVAWSSPVTNRLLLEAGMTIVRGKNNRQRASSPGDPAVLDQSRNYSYGNNKFGYGLSASLGYQTFGQTNTRLAVSYVTGSHAVKAGMQFMYAPRDSNFYQDPGVYADMSYTFNGTVPQSVTYYAGPIVASERQKTLGFYTQDQWTISRLTLNLGLRYDALNGHVLAQHIPAGTWVPARDFAEVTDVPSWKDLNPRLGAAYDLFGTGRTAVKGFVGRYVNFEAFAVSGANNPVNLIQLSASRVWNDENRDYIPQESELAPLSSPTFGQVVQTTFYGDDVLHGFGRRGYSWQGSVQLQHQLSSRVGLNVGYFRTSYGNFTVTANQLVTPADFNTYCVTAPTNSLLPGGGGYQVCGLYDITPAAFGRISNLVTHASNYGQQSDIFNGIDVTINARFGRGGIVQGGVSTGSEATDNCYVNGDPTLTPQGAVTTSITPRTSDFCHVTPPWSAGTQLKLSLVYPLPWELQFSGTYQNSAPIQTTASVVYTNAQILPSLGRNLGACGTRPVCTSTAVVEVVPAGTLYQEPRTQQVDIRFSRTFLVKTARVQPAFDLYNVFNANPVLGMTTRYGTSWRNATAVLAPRTAKFGVTVNF